MWEGKPVTTCKRSGVPGISRITGLGASPPRLRHPEGALPGSGAAWRLLADRQRLMSCRQTQRLKMYFEKQMKFGELWSEGALSLRSVDKCVGDWGFRIDSSDVVFMVRCASDMRFPT